MNRQIYRLHRWLALVATIQLALWTATGLFFAVVPIERVRGEDTTSQAEPRPLDWSRVGPFPPAALPGATEVELRSSGDRPVWIARAGRRRVRVDAQTGAVASVDREEAVRAARADQRGAPAARSVTRHAEAPLEYRGKPLPAWQVELDDERGTRVYVDAITGVVTARRNSTWRLYDFLWGLHIMDYGERESFNHPLLVGAAALGLLTVLSGAVLWIVRIARALRRTPGAARAPEA